MAGIRVPPSEKIVGRTWEADLQAPLAEWDAVSTSAADLQVPLAELMEPRTCRAEARETETVDFPTSMLFAPAQASFGGLGTASIRDEHYA